MTPSDPGLVSHGPLEVRDHNLRRQPRRGEDDRLQATSQELERDVPSRAHRRSSDSELTVDDGRVVDREVPLTARRTTPVDLGHLVTSELLGQLSGVGDRRGGADQLRVGAVEATQSTQPPQDVGDVRAVYAAQAVQLVHHDEAEVLEQLHPLRVVRQDPLVEHVGVRHHDVCARANRLAGVSRRVPVVGESADVRAERLAHRVKLGELILSQRLGREQVERPGLGLLEDRVENPGGCSRASCRRPSA